MDSKKFYTTDSLALTSYLELNGLKYVKADRVVERKGKGEKVKIVFHFLDPEEKGRDLELSFRFSNEKRYRDGLFFYRKTIKELLGVE